MISWVPQGDSHGCGVAALAMITCLTYAEVKAWFDQPFDAPTHGLSHFECDRFLAEHGYAVARRYIRLRSGQQYIERAEWPPAPFARVHLCQVRVSEGGMGHMVVMLGDGRVLDPAWPGQRALADYWQVDNVAGVIALDGRRGDAAGPSTPDLAALIPPGTTLCRQPAGTWDVQAFRRGRWREYEVGGTLDAALATLARLRADPDMPDLYEQRGVDRGGR